MVGCVIQSRDEEKAWVRSNTSVLLRSGRGFDKAVYQEMHFAAREKVGVCVLLSEANGPALRPGSF